MKCNVQHGAIVNNKVLNILKLLKRINLKILTARKKFFNYVW